MSSDDVVKMVAKAWGLPVQRLYGLCQLIDDMGWEATDLRRLLHALYQQGDQGMLITLCEWFLAESIAPSWRRSVCKLQAHWGKDGTIYFTLPAEAMEDFKKAPRCKAKTILEGRLKTL
jgi:hypothetical protein